MSIAREGLPPMEMSQELPLLSPSVPFARTNGGLQGNGRLPLRVQMKDVMISIGARSWSFPGARIDTDSWEAEWRDGNGKVYLHDGGGNVVEGTELSESEVEQMSREMLLADVLELAAAKLRSGEGWDEGTTADVLNEILHVFPGHAKKALALALLAGNL